MDTLNHKLDKNSGSFKTQRVSFQFKKEELFRFKGVYERMVNWASGEFDLFLQTESDNLKVYFPNGWFSISNVKHTKSIELIEIKVEGKSIKSCEMIVSQLIEIYNHVVRFSEERMSQFN